jgi:hypothetical protein
MAKTVHFRLPVRAQDGFKARTACGANSPSYSPYPADVTCRRCKGSVALKERKEFLVERARASRKK